MFATLDDLEGRVELIIFQKTLEQHGEAIDTDAVLLVRGRVDHKDRNETKLIVQEVEPFEPSGDEMEAAKEKVAAMDHREPLRLELDAAHYGLGVIEELKTVFADFPGEAEVVLVMRTREGERKLRFGKDYRVAPSAGLRAELDELLGGQSMAA
jgi:DNA polymerase-3 subunit alpha